MRTEARAIEAGPAMRDLLAKRPEAHKYDHGHALVLAGGPGRGGAARLAARAALRVGAGLVTVVCPVAALAENAARLDAVMLRGVADMDDLVEQLADPRITAVCLGPGLGTGDETLAKVTACLGAERACVLDADALSAFADAPETLFAQLHEACVMTPHGGEFRRLFPDLAARLDTADVTKAAVTRDAAARAGCTVLFKGAETVIAAADGRAWISDARGDRAAPWLATAGSGDVLAGMVAGLAARGLAPHEAACTAAWLHVEAARTFGPGLIAEDLPEALPAVFRALGLQA
jgi:hydroxyethylthiazole kinase-like uncharacterized protein yjeF